MCSSRIAIVLAMLLLLVLAPCVVAQNATEVVTSPVTETSSTLGVSVTESVTVPSTVASYPLLVKKSENVSAAVTSASYPPGTAMPYAVSTPSLELVERSNNKTLQLYELWSNTMFNGVIYVLPGNKTLVRLHFYNFFYRKYNITLTITGQWRLRYSGLTGVAEITELGAAELPAPAIVNVSYPRLDEVVLTVLLPGSWIPVPVNQVSLHIVNPAGENITLLLPAQFVYSTKIEKVVLKPEKPRAGEEATIEVHVVYNMPARIPAESELVRVFLLNASTSEIIWTANKTTGADGIAEFRVKMPSTPGLYVLRVAALHGVSVYETEFEVVKPTPVLQQLLPYLVFTAGVAVFILALVAALLRLRARRAEHMRTDSFV